MGQLVKNRLMSRISLIFYSVFVTVIFSTTVSAATFTVTNNLDSVVADPGSLREAINSANASSGSDEIRFDISGPTVISLSSNLPDITDIVVIDGTTQLGTDCGTTTRNIPIQIDNTGLIDINNNGVIQFATGSDGSLVRGLSITGFDTNAATNAGIWVRGANNVEIYCNNIGVASDGLTPGPNSVGIIVSDGSTGVKIGSDAALDRNLISGNQETDLIDPVSGKGIRLDSGSNVIKNNYIGTDKTGTIAVPNGGTITGTEGGIGISIADNSQGNTIESNLVSGHITNNIELFALVGNNSVKNNFVGTDYTGNAVIDGSAFGASFTQGMGINIYNGTGPFDGTNESNVIEGNIVGGLSTLGSSTGILVQNNNNEIYSNKLGIGADGVSAIPIAHGGIGVIGMSNTIGDVGKGNISTNANFGVYVFPSQGGANNTISYNDLYGNNVSGILVEGFNNKIEFNEIHDNGDPDNGGAGIMSFTIVDFGPLTPSGNTFSKNSIYNNIGLGIELALDGSPSDFSPETDLGPNINDAGDGDSGANDYLNSPTIYKVTDNGTDTVVDFNIDVPTGSYTIEFFANDALDPSGFGEGKEFIYSKTITATGGFQTFSETLTGVTGKYNLSTTLTDDATGSTSEFGGYDSDNDGIVNSVDLDSDNDGIPNSIEDANTDADNNPLTNPTDTDGDGIPDYLDLDSDNDGIADITEAGHGAADSNNDGMVDGSVGTNGLPDAVETFADSGVLNYTVLDSDGDGILDYLDLDSDNDGIADVLEGGAPDADNNGTVDGFTDANGDGLDDAVAAASGDAGLTTPDSDGDGILDYLDLDSDNDGIADVLEGGAPDADNNGTVDGFTDANGDGLDDAVAAASGDAGLTTPDSDGDGILDYLDLDSDNDGIADVLEGGAPDADNNGTVDGFTDANGDGLDDAVAAASGDAGLTTPDSDGDGILDYLDLDSDNDGIADVLEGGAPDADNNGTVDGFTDANGDGLDDAVAAASGDAGLTTPDSDGDGILDYLDLDSDNDGIADVLEGGAPDADNNGTVDGFTDANGDGLDDAVAAASGDAGLTTPDSDGDGILDYLDLDSDNDGIADVLEGGAPDADNNGTVDGFTDANGDGLDDAVAAASGDAGLTTPDSDGDGIYDYLDFDEDNDGILNIDEDVNNDGDPTNDDSDGDGIANYLDLDSDGDGIPDSVEKGDGLVDTDGDGTPDYIDLDSDSDGINDVIEAGHGATDADSDGRIDGLVGTNGLSDAVETSPDSGELNYTLSDKDGDNIPDYRDSEKPSSSGLSTTGENQKQYLMIAGAILGAGAASGAVLLKKKSKSKK
jgi:hypothetical protein